MQLILFDLVADSSAIQTRSEELPKRESSTV